MLSMEMPEFEFRAVDLAPREAAQIRGHGDLSPRPDRLSGRLLLGKPVAVALTAEAAALGLTFGDYNPHGQNPLPEAETEVRAVAEVFGAAPLLDAAATREAAFEALPSARYVHIATHGEHNADAPAFQFVYLAPSGESDGRLFAHELLSLDLRGLELLTLGACETALGRFDLSDNLPGLPASFLLAGVESLVGTLWPVESAPAELFFRTLYAELKAGRTRLDAFDAAPRSTRAVFDKYHRWGPFYLMGAWDGVGAPSVVDTLCVRPYH